MKSEAGLARKRAAPTKSEGSANRPSLILLNNLCARASFSRNERLVLSVSVEVGAIALTRTPRGAHSVESAAVRYDTPALAAPYTLLPMSVLADQVELKLMILP